MFLRIVFLISLCGLWFTQASVAQEQPNTSTEERFSDSPTTLVKQESMVELPRLEEILKLHYEAMGKEALSEVNTLSISGIEIKDNKLDQQQFTEFYKRDRKIRIEDKVQGSNYTKAFNGQEAWYENKSKKKNQRLSLSEAAILILRADIDGALFNYAAKDYTLELEGIDFVGETLTYELVLTTNLGTKVTYYVNTETFLIEKMAYDIVIIGDLVIHNELIYKTYQTIGGVQFPFMIEIWVDGDKQSVLVYKNILLNPDFADAFFDFPEKN
ncbi:MAG: hypothetical protein ACPGXL_01315 [Chitinophagales bacterium]